MEIKFLDDINLDELEGKDEVVKSIRFSKDEFYMIKYFKYMDKKFATYIKELIVKDIKGLEQPTRSIDIEKLKEELKSELRIELRKEILDEIRAELNSEISPYTNTNNEDKMALLDLINNR